MSFEESEGSRDILSKGIAVDPAHSNAKGTRLQDIMVGETLNQLDGFSTLITQERNKRQTSDLLPAARSERLWHSSFRSGRLRAA